MRSRLLERPKEAIADWDKPREIQRDDHEILYNRGLELAKLGLLEEAIASYDETLKIQPDFYEAWYNRGDTLFNLGRFEEAIASWNKALEIQPNLHQAWINLGVALDELGRHEEAIASYDENLKFQPGNYRAWYNRGVALGNLGRFEEAIGSFNKALELKPDYADAFYNKACCYALQGNVEQALENLQQAINLSPNEYRQDAKTDSDFDSLRDSERFQALIQEESDREDGEIDESEWLRAAATNPAFDFLKNPEEDIYTLDDGKPFNAAEDKPTQAEILADIRRDRSFNPASYGLPDSVTLLREDRDR